MLSILIFNNYIVLQNAYETLENITHQKMLIPTFLNSNDLPNDICELLYGYETYIKFYPKLKRSDRYVH